jgi:hypothetical protein
MTHKKGCCCCPTQRIPFATYIYAAVEGNVSIASGEARVLGDDTDTIYRYERGTLKGFDPVTGIFVAPKTTLYRVNAWVNYFRIRESSDPALLDGVTTTSIERDLQENICGAPGTGFGGLDIAIVSQTAPWSLIGGDGGNFLASSSLGGNIPLRQGDRLQLSIFQTNTSAVDAQIFAEVFIEQGPNITLGLPRGPGTV